MATAILQAGPGVDYPGSLERFSELETNDQVSIVPKTSAVANIPMVAFTGTDMVEGWHFEPVFTTTLPDYGDTIRTSDYFPYNFISLLEIPYQSSSFKLFSGDGFMAFLASMLRRGNGPYSTEPYLAGQAPILATGYTPETNLLSAANYAFASGGVAKTFKWPIRINAAQYFAKWYDKAADGRTLLFEDAYVSPLFMSSTGRNIVPKLQLASVAGATVDVSPAVVTTASGTAFGWGTDAGSVMDVRRFGWRQPANAADMPVIFNWAHQWQVVRLPIANARPSLTLPPDGQLLSVTARLFDPTLNSGAGGSITINNLVSAKLVYGSGINKFYDTPRSLQERMLAQHGAIFTKGVFTWDMYADTRSNRDCLNTYDVSAPTVLLDFTGNTPGAGSYADFLLEYMTRIA